ncbi:hypothetical protein ABE10_11435 [Bacillus toyonensis]|nr:hypothetical protein [Bacillus toyonensis]
MLTADLDKVLPPLPERKTKHPTSKRSTVTTERTAATVVGDRPGDHMAAECRISDLLVEVYGAEEDGNDGLEIPSPDGTYSGNGSNARIYRDDEDGIERVTVHGANRLDDFGIDSANSLSSWDWLGQVILAGDWSAAARLAHHYDPASGGSGWDDLIADLVAFDRDADSLLGERVPTAEPADELEALLEPQKRDDGTPLDPATATWAEALEHRIEREFPIRGTTWAIASGSNIGYWRLGKLDPKTKEREPDVRLTDWVAWRSEAHEYLTIDEEGQPSRVPQNAVQYRVQLVDRFGRRFTSQRLYGATESLTVAAIDELDAGVALPDQRNDERVIWDGMRKLGRHDGSQKRTRVFTSTGWLHEDGQAPVFLMPSGSYDHGKREITDAYRVDLSPGSEQAGLARLDRKVGLDALSEDKRQRQEAVDALFALIGIAGDDHVGVALIGALLAPLTGQQMNAPLDLYGLSGSGKSWIAACAQSFYTAYPLTGKAFMLSIPHSTPTGSSLKASFFRHLAVFADDLRVSGSPRDTERMRSLATSLIQQAYGAEGATKGATAVSLAGVPTVTSGAILTSEHLIQETAVMRRIVGLEAISYNAEAATAFKRSYVASGTPRRFLADYIQHIAERIEDMGGLAELADDATTAAEDWTSAHKGYRPGVDVVGVLASAWGSVFDYLEKHGLRGDVSKKRVGEVLAELADRNAESVQSTDVGKGILDHLRGVLESRSGYLTPWHGQPPVRRDAAAFGWHQAQSDSGSAGYFAPTNASMLGYVSRDGQSVVLSAEALRRHRGAAGSRDMEMEQLYRLLRKYAVEGAPTPGKQQSTTLGLVSAGTTAAFRPKGITIPATLLRDGGFPKTARPKDDRSF